MSMRAEMGRLVGFLILPLLVAPVAGRAAGGNTTILDATEVLEEIMKIPEQRIPPSLLRNAHNLGEISG